MREEKIIDYEKYIQERLREIDDLDERREAKQILLKGLGSILELAEERFQKLEQRIKDEIEIPWNCYAIATTIIDCKLYDPINGTLFPVCPEDVDKKKHKYIHTVYLQADDADCHAFLKRGIVEGYVGEGREKISFKISKSLRYEQALQSLYQLFKYNQIPWNTVHIGYLERFFDLIPEGNEDRWKAISPGEEIDFQWMEWQPYAFMDRIPLWNVKQFRFRSQEFMVPCIDSIYYEHNFRIEEEDKNGEKSGYLIGMQEEIEEIRYERDKIILKSKSEVLEAVTVYQIYSEGIQYSAGYHSKIISNSKKNSFAGRYLYKMGNFLQTGMELLRKIEELSGDYKIQISSYEIIAENNASVLAADMNYFIQTEVFPDEQRKILLFHFEKPETEEYLYQAQVRFVLSQLQMEYLEYKCVGSIAKRPIGGTVDELCMGTDDAGR